MPCYALKKIISFVKKNLLKVIFHKFWHIFKKRSVNDFFDVMWNTLMTLACHITQEYYMFFSDEPN